MREITYLFIFLLFSASYGKENITDTTQVDKNKPIDFQMELRKFKDSISEKIN